MPVMMVVMFVTISSDVQGDFGKFGESTTAKFVWFCIPGLDYWRGKVCLAWNFRIWVLHIVMGEVIHEDFLVEWTWTL